MVLDHSQFLSQYIKKTNQAEFFALKKKKMKQQQHDINFEEDSEKKIRVADGI